MSIDIATERAVARQLRDGRSPTEIAREAGIARETVRKIGRRQRAVEKAVRCPGCGALIDATKQPCLLCRIRHAEGSPP